MESKRSKSSADGWVSELGAKIQGKVIAPDQRGYDENRMGWNLAVDQRPALIALPENPADIAEAVRFARDHDLKVSIKATGHGVIRPADENCLLIVTSNMIGVQVDPEKQTARIEAGAKWGVVLEKAQAHGLAPLLGSSPDVGAVAYTLGGGMGWLARKYGLAADSVHAFEMVTATGQIITASESQNPDLFWGLRGGGGSLGIVSQMVIQLYPVTTVYGGNLIYPMDQARDVMTNYRVWLRSTPDELTSSIALMNLPPLPIVPEFLRGKSVVMVRGCFCGPIEEGEALVQPWREWREPMADLFRPMPFSEVASISNDPEDPVPGYITGAWLEDLSDETIDILLRYVAPQEGQSPILMAEVRHAGGAISRFNPLAAAYSNRDARLIMECIGMTPTPEAHAYLGQTLDRLKLDLEPHMTGGVYMNFLEGEESRERIRDGFSPEAYRRLTALKGRFDPENRFSYGFNIPPAAG